ncbi:MAG: hypothetical protein IPK82_15250 [Polyangiaceae bacterium]|nr:hypothetical protein [Polyangiaceae bacterium]
MPASSVMKRKGRLGLKHHVYLSGARWRSFSRACLPAVIAAGAMWAAGCKTDGAAVPKVLPPPPSPFLGFKPFGPAQYLQSSYHWVERTEAGLDHVLNNGRRTEIKGLKTVRTVPTDDEINGAEAMPSWVKGPARYVFWKDRDVFVSATFMGDLVKVATLPSDVQHSSFEWLTGLTVYTDTALFVVSPGTAPDLKDTKVTPLAMPGVVNGLAADEKRAVVTNVFGRSLLTIDGGKTYRDLSEEMGEIQALAVHGNDLVLEPYSGSDRFVGPNGVLSDTAISPGPRRGSEPPEIDDTFGESTPSGALYALSVAAIPLENNVILTYDDGALVKVDANTNQVLASASLEELNPGDCQPLRVPDAVLLACKSGDRALVLDVTGVPKIERTFEAENTAEDPLDTFSVADGVGIGFLGPCSGSQPLRDEVDAVSGASQRNMSTQRSPVFCARASADHWIEHRLNVDDGANVIGWAARPGGDAVALVAKTDRLVPDHERVSTQGGLRIVRFPRQEPPLALSGYSTRGFTTVSREFRANSDGTVEAWLSNNNYGNGVVSVVIDTEGHVRVRPNPPRISQISSSGPFAFAKGDDGRLYETVDWGKKWIDAEPPPGSLQYSNPSSCTAVACGIGSFVRVGWNSVDPKLPAAAADYERSRNDARILREKYEYRRAPPKPGLSKLNCSFASPAEGARQSDSYGFGFGPSNSMRSGGANRLGTIGAFSLPWWQGTMPSGLDMDLAWVDPFDLDARIHRASIPLSRVGLNLNARPYEVRFGSVLDEEGRIELVSTGYRDQCVAPLLEEAGITLKIGSCVAEATMGVRIKDRLFLGNARWGSWALSVLDLPSASASVSVGSTVPRELRSIHQSGQSRFLPALGIRAGAPVAVAIDGLGKVVASPVDPNDGYLGAVEEWVPLTELRIGSDAKCPTQDKLSDDEARVLVPYETTFGLARGSLPGVVPSGTGGVAIVRWSKTSVCLEAVEMAIRDDRFDPEGAGYDPPGMLRKLIARFVKAPPKRGGAGAPQSKQGPKKATPAASASASASAAASASPASIPPWASPYGATPTPSASASAAPTATVAPIPPAPSVPKGAGEGTLLVVHYGSEVRQRLFCTGITPP